MTLQSDSAWPPGGEDSLLSALAEVYIVPGNRLDLAGLLADPRLGRVALVSSFGAEAAVTLHMVAEAAPETPVLFIDTGQHFEETLVYREALVERLALRDVRTLRPEASLMIEEDPRGDLWNRDPDMCCALRKTFPLQDALAGFDAWITGRKRHHGGARSGLPYLERDGRHIKINPLIEFGPERIAAYFQEHDLPPHPLQATGYRSIGCRPCTRPMEGSAGARDGRWFGRDKVECGIHLGPDGRFVRSGRGRE